LTHSAASRATPEEWSSAGVARGPAAARPADDGETDYDRADAQFRAVMCFHAAVRAYRDACVSPPRVVQTLAAHLDVHAWDAFIDRWCKKKNAVRRRY
jgi:hypothetical protein